MNPKNLTCYKSPFPKIRLGKDNDGGYVICEIPNVNYDCLLAGGVGSNVSFEEHFLSKYTSKCYAFDGTIDSFNTTNKEIVFMEKNIGFYDNDNETNLHNLIEQHQNIMVKMDIEGGEIPWIESLTYEHLNKFVQIVMEFHFPFSERENKIFEKLNQTHLLVHFHANNYVGLQNIDGINIPQVFECTYVNKKYLINDNYQLNTDLIPSDIDMNNDTRCGDISIDWEPFVHK